MDTIKKKYLLAFLILVTPPILVRIFSSLDLLYLTEDLAAFLTIVSKLGLIIITIWCGARLRINIVLAILLGLSTLLPLMTWISLIILFTRKQSENNIKSRKQDNLSESNKDIKEQLTNNRYE